MAAAAGVAGRALLAVFGEKLVEGIGKAVTDFDFNKVCETMGCDRDTQVLNKPSG